MTFLKANYSEACSGNGCDPLGLLTFLNCLVHHLRHSRDKSFIKTNNKKQEQNYDFIVVGAGSAGCVVANRLSENKLEDGDEEPAAADVPGMWEKFIGSSLDYGYKVSYESMQTKSKNIGAEHYVRGKVMGGSSTINGMIYARGSRADYDKWAKDGNNGWSWRDVLPYFKKSEKDTKNPTTSNRGYLNIEPPPKADIYLPIFLNAWKEIGLNETDCNNVNELGVSIAQYTTVRGSRQSSNKAFIKPIRSKRQNLTIKTKARVTKIIVNPKTKEAIGVEYEMNGPRGTLLKKAYASKEVIISAGVVESPKLLMLSGIGPMQDLQRLNIKAIKDLPVGRNLQDHVRLSTAVFDIDNASFPETCESLRNHLVYWTNKHEGPWSNPNGAGVIAYYQSQFEKSPGVADLQYFVGRRLKFDLPYFESLGISMFLVSSKIRGSVRLNATDPTKGKPELRWRSLPDDRDVEVLMEGMKFALKLGSSNVLKDHGIKYSRKHREGCENLDFESENYLKCVIRKYASPGLHGAGTCKMGPKNDKTAVVDSELKVHGIRRLRVIDASIMPTVVRGNPNGPTIMIGEKGSDMIKSNWL